MTTLLKLRRALVYALTFDATYRGLAPMGGRPLAGDALGAADAAARRAAAKIGRR